MQTTMLQYALSAGLAGVLAIGAGGGSPGSVQTGAKSASQVAQYCVPPEQDPNSHRLFCGIVGVPDYQGAGRQTQRAIARGDHIPPPSQFG